MEITVQTNQVTESVSRIVEKQQAAQVNTQNDDLGAEFANMLAQLVGAGSMVQVMNGALALGLPTANKSTPPNTKSEPQKPQDSQEQALSSEHSNQQIASKSADESQTQDVGLEQQAASPENNQSEKNQIDDSQKQDSTTNEQQAPDLNLAGITAAAVQKTSTQTNISPTVAPSDSLTERATSDQQKAVQQILNTQQAVGQAVGEESKQVAQQAVTNQQVVSQTPQTQQNGETKVQEPAVQKAVECEAVSTEPVKQEAQKAMSKSSPDSIFAKAAPAINEQSPAVAPLAPAQESAGKEQLLSKSKPENVLPAQLSALVQNASVSETAAQGAGFGSALGQGINALNSMENLAKEAASDKAGAGKNGRKSALSSLPQPVQDAMVEKVKELLKQASQNSQGNTLVVRLDPPELGSMLLKVTHRDKNTFVRLIPESAEVETVLRSRTQEIINVLTNIGLNPKNVHISVGAERSETELFQFQQFLKDSGSGSSQGHEFSNTGYQGENSELAGQQSGSSAPLIDSGWVA